MGHVGAFRAALPDRVISDALEPALAELHAAGRAAWPGVEVAAEGFVRALAERLPAGAELPQALAAVRATDLYLVCGCAAGDPAAIAAFDAHCGAMIERAVASTGASAAERADLGQVVRQRLLVAPADGGPPPIATYSARGSLLAWVRVVATREAARMLPRERREPSATDHELAALITPDDDPETGYLKRLYREEFKLAFTASVAALDDRARLVLRQHMLDGLGIDRLAALHGVHRATAARWIEAAREDVVAGTRRELIRRLRLTATELASVIRLIRSQLDLSLPRVLVLSPPP